MNLIQKAVFGVILSFGRCSEESCWCVRTTYLWATCVRGLFLWIPYRRWQRCYARCRSWQLETSLHQSVMPFWNHSVFFDRLLKIKIHNIVTSLLISWPRILIFWALARTCFRKDKWAANMDCHFAKPSKPSWSQFFYFCHLWICCFRENTLNTSLSKTQMIRERASWKTTREKKG